MDWKLVGGLKQSFKAIFQGQNISFSLEGKISLKNEA